jgi:hypothetical protein
MTLRHPNPPSQNVSCTFIDFDRSLASSKASTAHANGSDALFAAIGQAGATLFVVIFPLIGLLAAIFILPEVYGHEHD